MNSKTPFNVLSLFLTFISMFFLVFPMPTEVYAKEIEIKPSFQIRDLDPLGIHKVQKRAQFSPDFSFYEQFNNNAEFNIKKPVSMSECKSVNAECSINESGKSCCAGLSCVPFNSTSGNGKCQYDACTNGATNPPNCTTCAAGTVLFNGACVAACTNPQANNQGQPLPCTFDETEEIPGCMDVKAINYNDLATVDDGTCKYSSTEKTLPTPPVIPVTGRFSLIAAGTSHTCALTPNSRLKCWGNNEYGQLGNASYITSNLSVTVKSIDPRTVVSLAAGSQHTCALLSSGEVMCWGLNSSGQVGDGTNINRAIPVKVKGLNGKIVAITAGLNNTCALKANNETMCWGDNSSGQFANGTNTDSNKAVLSNITDVKLISGAFKELQAVTLDGSLSFFSDQPTIPVTGLTNDISLVSGNRFDDGGCAITQSGNVQCWGSIKGSEIKLAQLTELLATGQNHGCVLNENGLVCWGDNSNGQLGNGSQLMSESPVMVKDVQSVIALAAGAKHSCAIIDAKTIKCWGSNDQGQLGNGVFEDSSIPVLVK